MGARQSVHEEVTVVGFLPATAIADATPVLSSAIDLRTYPGARFLVVATAFETNVGNTGGAWTITESATSGGTYAAATLGGAFVATPAAAGNDVQAVSLIPNAAKPFVKITYTGADANAEVSAAAVLVVLPQT